MNDTTLAKHSLKDKFTQQLDSSLFGSYPVMNLYRTRRLFVLKFNYLPNLIVENQINASNFYAAFRKEYKNCIYEDYYGKRGSKNHSIKMVDYYCFLKEDILVHIDFNEDEISLLFNKTNEEAVNEIQQLVVKHRQKIKKEPKINVVVSSQHGLSLHLMDLNTTELDIEANYNDDFLAVHQTILARIKKKKDKGLVLLHGKPGTGKTTYIKHLISQVEKEVVFMPPNLANQITNPGLLELLIENPNSILVIEDAEDIILERNQKSNSAVSALLNLSDGILAECLNIQIICSFNTQLSKIDSALLRKGRLIARYEFEELALDKVNNLCRNLGLTQEYFEPQVLAEIFNQHEKASQQKQKKIGFFA